VNKKTIDKALSDYIRRETEGKSFPTGWVLVASLAPPNGDTGRSDSYITLSSDGLPVHTQMGLMELAQADMKNLSMLSIIGQSIKQLFGGKIDGEEDRT
jgi:hypothetical protein